jgi:tetratricopeptide (TPR) repeat protein/predicted Ser/Thr protein kinase
MTRADSMIEQLTPLRRACDELSGRLRSGEACQAEEYLANEPAIGSDTDAVLELLYTEFVVREQLGEHPRPEEWLVRFPQWRAELAQLFQIHALVDGDDTQGAERSGTHRDKVTTARGEYPSGADRNDGRFLGGYEILQEIGRGGMGVVYQARQRGLGRIVALKMILPPHGPRERARFRAEAEATARLSHPNIVQIYEVGQEGDQPYLSMEFIAGKSLDKQLASPILAPQAAAEMALTLARAVAYAHEQGIVHRDLKPANVVLAADGTPKITDFGLATTLSEGQAEAPSVAIVGTPSYMAPEQCGLGGRVGLAADIYALGAILYEALTGRPPFRGQTAMDILELVRSNEPVPPGRLTPNIPRDLETICLKCLAKQPPQRYASARALAEDLQRFHVGEPILARPAGRAERAVRWCFRNPAIATLAAGVVLLLVCGTVVSTSLAVWALNEKHRAAQHAHRADDSAVQARTSAKQEQSARELAEFRFTQAERAVEEYLDGIENNEQLKEADFLELRKRLVASAIPFYEEFVQQRPGDKAIEIKRGRAYGRLGFIRKLMGEWEQAATDFEQMRAIFNRLETTDSNVRRELARSHSGLASTLVGIGRHPEAEIEYRRSFDLLQELAAAFPHDAGYRKQLAACQRDLGLLFNQVGKHAEAVAELRGALAIAAELAADYPNGAEYRADLAGIHSYLASILGVPDEAEAYHREAVDSYQQLAAEFPNQPTFRRGLGTAHTNLGVFLSNVRKNKEEALVEYRAAVALCKQLAAGFPAIPDYRRQLALGHRNLASRLATHGNREEAEVEVRTAIALLKQLVADFPATPLFRSDLARSHDDLARQLQGLNQLEDSEAEFRQALAIFLQLVVDVPTLPDYRKLLAKSHDGLGLLLARSGRSAEAEVELVDAIELRKKLLTEFPENQGIKLDLASGHGNLGLVLSHLKRRDEAKAREREAIPLYAQLMESSPDRLRYRTNAAINLNNLASLLRKDGEIDEARRCYAQAAECHDKALQIAPGNATYAQALREDYHGVGDMALLQKDHAGAAEAADKMAQVRPDNATDAELAARFFGRCVTLAEQDPALSKTGRQTLAVSYADRAMEYLREAVCRGYDKVASLKSLAALAPLRERPDFQQLVEELEAR